MVNIEKNYKKYVIGLLVFKEDQIILGKVKTAQGFEYAVPQDFAKDNEKFEDGATRIIGELCGIEIGYVNYSFTSDLTGYIFPPYTYFGARVKWKSGELQNYRPEIYMSFEWHNIKTLPSPLVRTTKWAVNTYNEMHKMAEYYKNEK